MERYHVILFSFFLAIFIWSGISPVSYTEWVLETLPIVIAVATLFFIGKRYKLSNLSYTLLTLYFCLALLPGHYNVSKVPFGETLGQWIGSDRNMYDRLLHFSLGFLCFSTFYEICLQLITKKDVWRYIIPFGAVLSFSAIYEMMEWIAHLFIPPAASITFVGSQGDLWDPAKDMTLAALGAIIVIIVFLFVYRKKKSAV